MLRLDHQTLNDRAYGALKQGLISGKFDPGEVLVIRKLAELYGISATPVREALQRLVAEGALELRNNRSVAVPTLSAATFEELVSVRCAMEGLAGARAAPRMAEATLSTMRGLLADMDKAIAGRQSRRYLTLNEKFHFAIYRSAGSPVILGIVEDLWGRIGPYLNVLMDSDSYVPASNNAHRRILAALEKRDGPATQAHIEDDIRKAAKILSGHLKDQP
jgi:DNA-binding GntR family transcriptional regulator